MIEYEPLLINFPVKMIDIMDRYKETGFFLSRSELIRQAVKEYMQRNPVEQIGIPEASDR